MTEGGGGERSTGADGDTRRQFVPPRFPWPYGKPMYAGRPSVFQYHHFNVILMYMRRGPTHDPLLHAGRGTATTQTGAVTLADGQTRALGLVVTKCYR